MNPLRADQISPLDMFKIGVGPSSSHTVGPMVAAKAFRNEVQCLPALTSSTQTLRFQVELYGSLSATGKGHSTDAAIAAGLFGLDPRESQPDQIWEVMPNLEKQPLIQINDRKVSFEPSVDIVWQSWTIDEKPL